MRGSRDIAEIAIVYTLRLAALVVIVVPLIILSFVGIQALQLFTIDHISLGEFLGSAVFDPDGGRPGALAFIVGSLSVTGYALAIGTPLGFAAAICIVEFAPLGLSRFLRGAIELLAGVPSVVFGWIGLQIIVPFIRHATGTSGFGVAAAALVLSVMILPTIVTLAADSLFSVSRVLRENSMALGATRWETLAHVIIPAARHGLLIACILAMARAMGETLAVEMVIGNAGILPRDLFHAAATLPAEIVLDMGGAPPGSLLEHALFAMAFVLLCISTLLITFVRLVARSRVRV